MSFQLPTATPGFRLAMILVAGAVFTLLPVHAQNEDGGADSSEAPAEERSETSASTAEGSPSETPGSSVNPGNGNANGESNGQQSTGNSNGNGKGKALGRINNGKPVPKIGKNKSSADFLKERIAKDALFFHGGNYAQALDSFASYATILAKTLSQLTPEEQQEIFYGQSK